GPRRNLGLFDALQAACDAGLAEVLLRENVGCDLAPMLGHEEAVKAENDGAVGVLDFARGAAELDRVVRRLAGFGEAPRNRHQGPPWWSKRCSLAPTRDKTVRRFLDLEIKALRNSQTRGLRRPPAANAHTSARAQNPRFSPRALRYVWSGSTGPETGTDA